MNIVLFFLFFPPRFVPRKCQRIVSGCWLKRTSTPNQNCSVESLLLLVHREQVRSIYISNADGNKKVTVVISVCIASLKAQFVRVIQVFFFFCNLIIYLMKTFPQLLFFSSLDVFLLGRGPANRKSAHLNRISETFL